jgi:hypothetical protein
VWGGTKGINYQVNGIYVLQFILCLLVERPWEYVITLLKYWKR